MAEYDSIAADYKKSKFAPWRIAVEVHSLFNLLGDVRGARVLDLACGDGIYSRRLRERGAARVVGVDLSSGMIDLARAEEAARPLGIEYHVGAAQELALGETFDVVFAAYLLNYARSLDELAAFASAVAKHLRPGGRFVGINNNPAHAPELYAATKPFGFVKNLATGASLVNGTAITYTFFQDGHTFHFDNFYLEPQAHASVLAGAGLKDFAWHPLLANPAGLTEQDRALDWDGFVSSAPVLCFSAVRRS
ncbi:MAG: class I SAM-dependent methyltransferase [Opitutaceae bacterium]|nr:class I SAM-dependent methyltransferase [Opitutaceae bacterium]